MKVEYALFASFAQYMPTADKGSTCAVELKKGSTVDMLIRKLQLPAEKPKMIFVNNRREEADIQLNNGDRVAIFPIVAGGG